MKKEFKFKISLDVNTESLPYITDKEIVANIVRIISGSINTPSQETIWVRNIELIRDIDE